MNLSATKTLRNAIATSLIFFVLCSLDLPQKSEVFALLNESQTQLIDSTQNDVLSKNSDKENLVILNAESDKNNTESRWFRLVKEGDVPVELDVSIVRYSGTFADESGAVRDVSIDLIGAIHLAEKEYYDSINEEFKTYDSVVFELVTNKGVDVKKMIRDERKANAKTEVSPIDFISYSQLMMSRALNLCYQLDGIDYLPDNLVRGDIDTEDFIVQLLSGGRLFRYVSDFCLELFADHSTAGALEGAAIALFCSHNRVRVGRRILAVELMKSALDEIEDSQNALEKIENEQQESVLINARNKIALARAVKELKAGKSKIAIFYGAAHLPDLEQRLEKELNLKRDPNTRWFPAWKMR